MATNASVIARRRSFTLGYPGGPRPRWRLCLPSLERGTTGSTRFRTAGGARTWGVNDSHVTALIYRFRSLEPMDRFGAAAPLDAHLDLFRVRLEGETLRAEPLDHHAAEDEARAALEPRLRDWEVAARLAVPPHAIRFDYLDAEIVDRSPTPGATVALAGSARAGAFTADASITVDNARFPEPDPAFRTNSLVESVLDRLERSRRDATRLAYDAYWVHVAACGEFDGEAGAAEALGVSANVLKQLKRIANKRDPAISRKPAGPLAPISPEERAWLLEVMRVVAERAGRRQSLALSPPLTLADLPPLP
jgi:hypothetical protein